MGLELDGLLTLLKLERNSFILQMFLEASYVLFSEKEWIGICS